MTSTAMVITVPGLSPKSKARLTGLFEVLEGITATYGQVIVRGEIVVMGSAATTAANLLGHQQLFWLGFASSLVGVGFHIAWALLMYELFTIVNRTVARMALLVILVGCAIQGLTAVLYVAPWLVLTGGPAAHGFTGEQLQSLAYIVFRWNGYAFNVYLVFFGLWCFLNGYLIFKSRFMPRILGVLLAISGLGWMMYLVPPLASSLFAAIATASAMGELPLQLWLLIKGVNELRWKEQAVLAKQQAVS